MEQEQQTSTTQRNEAEQPSTSSAPKAAGPTAAERDTLMLRALHGRILSIDFFRRNWIWITAIVLMFMIYITGRYECQTQMETIRSLERELEVAKTERIRAKSVYMSRIRESSMQHMVDSLHLDLTVQEQPPYRIHKSTK